MTLPRPNVSVIVPCYNEEATIRWLLEALYQQSYPRDEIEVIISDGMSTDCTRQEINSFQLNHPGYALRIIDNPDRAIPSGLNRAIQAARGEYIVRLDAHSIPYPDYIENCIRDL